MKRMMLIFLALSAFVGGVQSQGYTHWTLSHEGEGGASNTPVYAKLNLGTVVNEPDWTTYEVAAFIDGEVRAVSLGSEDVSPARATTQDFNYFVLNVQGNYDKQGRADEGKTITFKMYNHATGIEYNLTSNTATFGSEKSYGSLTSLFELKAVEVTSIALSTITMSVGATVDLKNYLTLRPSNATMPNNMEWSAGNFANSLVVEGSMMTAVETGTFQVYVLIGTFTGTSTPLTATAEVQVSEEVVRATAIRIRDGYNPIVVKRGNDGYLNAMLSAAYELVPFDAVETVYWEVTGPSGIVVPTPIVNQFYPEKQGETRMQAYILDDNGGVRLRSPEITVRVTVDVEEIAFTLSPTPLVQGFSGTLTLTPNEGATINIPNLLVREVGSDYDIPWKLLQIGTPEAKSDGSVTVPVTALYPGQGKLQVTYDSDATIDPINFEVGVPLALKKGWQWITLWSYINEEEFPAAFGKNVDEIRSQTQLLAYDATYGFFGDLYPSPYDGLKLKATAEVKAANAYVMTGGSNNLWGSEIQLNKAWTWITYPYVHSFAPDALQLDAVNGDRIVSKDDGFVEYSNGKWTGTLNKLNPYEAYLYYNNKDEVRILNWPSEGELNTSGSRILPNPGSLIPNPTLHQSGWEYDSSRFRDNMSIVARLDGMSKQYFTVGAYVDDECRGEGVFVDGLLFITVHANNGEMVSFRLKSSVTGNMYTITETLPATMALGSLQSPVRLTAPAFATGIENIENGKLKIENSVYDLNGRRMDSSIFNSQSSNLRKGVTIQRQADGSVRKVAM